MATPLHRTSHVCGLRLRCHPLRGARNETAMCGRSRGGSSAHLVGDR
jgi:hypothetical protein